jgi:fatty-acyl-CoA synthase/long-chain acyl-CoA synthetase
MSDYLTAYAAAQPDKVAVIDDRRGADVRTLTFAELEDRANRLANVLLDHGVAAGTTVVWCGQNSVGVVEAINACRKVGAVAVPLNYRLSDEEAAYVIDHSDAQIVYVDADFAPMVARVRSEIPKVQHVFVFDGDTPDGMTAV